MDVRDDGAETQAPEQGRLSFRLTYPQPPAVATLVSGAGVALAA